MAGGGRGALTSEGSHLFQCLRLASKIAYRINTAALYNRKSVIYTKCLLEEFVSKPTKELVWRQPNATFTRVYLPFCSVHFSPAIMYLQVHENNSSQ